MDPMVANWVAGCVAIIASVLLQFGAQTVLFHLAARHRGHMLRMGVRGPHLVVPILFVVFVLIFGHLAQMAVWAGAYAVLGELQTAENAVFFSMASYTTVGANHIELSTQHRILGTLEAAVGIMMFGWSTALLVALLVNTADEEGTR